MINVTVNCVTEHRDSFYLYILPFYVNCAILSANKYKYQTQIWQCPGEWKGLITSLTLVNCEKIVPENASIELDLMVTIGHMVSHKIKIVYANVMIMTNLQ